MTERRKFTAEFKARVALKMLTEQKSAAQASREYGIKDSVLSRWKQEFIERSPILFQQGASSDDYPPVQADEGAVEAAIDEIVGRFPTYGAQRVTHQLKRLPHKMHVNRKRVRRIMAQKGLLRQGKRSKKRTTDSEQPQSTLSQPGQKPGNY